MHEMSQMQAVNACRPFLCAGFIVIFASAQTVPTFRSTTQLVHVNVVVLDKNGSPVQALTREDFELLDNGRPQQIKFFEAQDSKTTATRTVELPPGVVSNDWQRGATNAAITVILLDTANSNFTDIANARGQLVKFVAQIRPTDHVGIYLLGHNLRILHDFSSDAEDLAHTISTYRVPLIDIQAPVVDPLQRTFIALMGIAHHLSGLPGRKNLIWVSSAFQLFANVGGSLQPGKEHLLPTDREIKVEYPATFGPAMLALNAADVAVYPVDARGLNAEPQWDRTYGYLNGRLVPPPLGSSVVRTMIQVAHETGGRAFFDSNEIMGAVRTVLDNSRVSYSLAFYPTSSRADNSFHDLSVRVNRPGVTVHCRSGYFDKAGGGAPEDFIRAILANRLEATGLGVMARAQAAGSGKLVVEIQVEAGGITTTEDRNGKRTAALDFALAPMDGNGTSFKSILDPFTINLDARKYDLLLRSGVRYKREMQVDRRATMLRIVVRDRTSGAMGSVTVPLRRDQ